MLLNMKVEWEKLKIGHATKFYSLFSKIIVVINH